MTSPNKGRIFRHGFFMVLIGPDGSGKSSMARAVKEALRASFASVFHFHWRPGLLPKPAAAPADNKSKSTQPPNDYAYGRLMSLARYLYYLTDFVAGYWFVIYPKKVRRNFVLGERWYYDVIVNPQRYGFNLPLWLLRLGGRLVPEPDLTVLLEAPAEEIHARKPELTVEQLERQMRLMRAVLPNYPAGLSISTACSVEESVRILNRSVQETMRHCAASASYASGRRDGWRAFPRTRNAKLWIHTRDPIANALHLYRPYYWVGRAACRVAPYLPRWLTTQRLPLADELRLERLADAIQRMLGRDGLVISFYTGTPNAHRKITAQVSHDGTIVAYVKIGSTDAAKNLIESEALALSRIDAAALGAVVSVPRVLAQSTIDNDLLLALSAPPSPGRQRPIPLDERDIRFLVSLVPQQPQVESLANVLDAIRLGVTSRAEYPVFIMHACEAVTALLKYGVRMGPAHGDYVPWNTLALSDGSLYVFDWEHAAEVPLLSDLFHRIFMPDRLVNGGIPPRAAVARLLALTDNPLIRPILGKSGIKAEEYTAYLLLYFLHLAVRETREKGSIDDYLQECFHLILVFAGHLAHRRRVLVSAYACEPDKGSEPGVGWHWVTQIARHNDVWVITRKNNRPSIERALQESPVPNLRFFYQDPPRFLTFWKRGSRGIHLYYYLWQWSCLPLAYKLHRRVRFDLAHHVTFVNDWIWTFLALLPIKYVWGPIGSNVRCPPQLLPHLKARFTDMARIIVQNCLRIFDPLLWLSAIRASWIIVINNEVASTFPLRFLGSDKLVVHPAIGCDPRAHTPARHGRSTVEILYVGRYLPIKGGALAVDAFAHAAHRMQNIHLTLVGEGPEESDLRRRVASHGLEGRVTFLSWQPQSTVWRIMEAADIFLFPSLEGSGMVVIEAMQAELPVVCLAFGGPGSMVNEDIGRTIRVGSRDSVVQGIADELVTLSRDSVLRKSLGKGGRFYAETALSWSAKIAFLDRMYHRIVSHDLYSIVPRELEK